MQKSKFHAGLFRTGKLISFRLLSCRVHFCHQNFYPAPNNCPSLRKIPWYTLFVFSLFFYRQAILLLKSYFGREKINFHEKNLKYRKIIILTNFIFTPTFFLIASYQIFKNYAILINYKSLFQEKNSLQLYHFQFSKKNKLLSNSAICL